MYNVNVYNVKFKNFDRKLMYIIDLCHNFVAEKEMKRSLRIKILLNQKGNKKNYH